MKDFGQHFRRYFVDILTIFLIYTSSSRRRPRRRPRRHHRRWSSASLLTAARRAVALVGVVEARCSGVSKVSTGPSGRLCRIYIYIYMCVRQIVKESSKYRRKC